MSKASRVTDTIGCPGSSPVPHVGGFIVGPGVPTVVIGHRPAATVGTPCACVVPAGNVINGGSGTVTIAHQPAARAGDPTSHGGSITGGCPNVEIGD
ncbi:MAG TPA: PAAR domain-containing protein [Enhygromyxa sp.]|nr:PAAR domain-containing protein [Enhygromyxa sp.]